MNNQSDNTIICRCEDLTLGDIRKAIAEGCETVDEIKRVTRAGMGPCQGRTCASLIAAELSRYYKIPMEDIIRPTFRPTIKPVKLGSFVVTDAGANSIRPQIHEESSNKNEKSL